MSRAARMFGDPLGDLPPGAPVDDESFLPAEVPLTVAAVAARLGVAPSTLRTWDRRYGLGPSGRAAGSHRRYTPEDVARLETMRRLTLAGAAPSDAARLAAPGARPTASDAPEAPNQTLVDDLTLAAGAVEGAESRVRAMLAAWVRSRGLLRTWLDVAEPALGILAERESGYRAGRDPEVLLAGAVLASARDLADASPAFAEDAEPPRVALLADPVSIERVGAHVLAAALAERGLAARVVSRRVDLPILLRLLEGAPAAAIGLIGRPAGGEQVAREASERGGVPVFLIGQGSPELWLPGVVRVRTLPAAVHEIVDLLAGGTKGVSRRGEGKA